MLLVKCIAKIMFILLNFSKNKNTFLSSKPTEEFRTISTLLIFFPTLSIFFSALSPHFSQKFPYYFPFFSALYQMPCTVKSRVWCSYIEPGWSVYIIDNQCKWNEVHINAGLPVNSILHQKYNFMLLINYYHEHPLSVKKIYFFSINRYHWGHYNNL